MVLNVLLREFEGDILEENIIAPLSTLLTAMNRYSVLPVYTLHFIVSKTTFMPYMVLAAYSDVALIISATQSNTRLQSIMADSMPSATSPTVIVGPMDVPMADVLYNSSDMFYYSSSYILAGKEVKSILKGGAITKLSIYTNQDKRLVSCRISGAFDADDMIFSPLPENIVSPIRLPFINFTKKNPGYTPVLTKVIEGSDKIEFSEASKLKEIFESVKKKQCIDVGNNTLVYKDFIKLKPSKLAVYSALSEIEGEAGVRAKSVCLTMDYQSVKNYNVVFYRYIDGLVDVSKMLETSDTEEE